MRRLHLPVLPVLLLLFPCRAHAVDTQREVRPGVTYFERTTGGARPQHIFAVGVDLSHPNVGLQASADARYSQWDVNTLTFAENTGSIAAINADWSCIPAGSCGDMFHRPLGLAVSGGSEWNPHRENEDIGLTWGYLGCTIGKRCDIGWPRALSHPEMLFSPLHNPTVAPLRYHNAVGGNGMVLIDNGVPATGCFDSGTDTPRSAVCLQADGIHMWMVVVDGRGTNDGDTGMTCDETRDMLLGAPFNCFDALMLDGGGSSTLVVEDTAGSTCRSGLCIKNNPSDGAPRTVGNHLGIIYSDTLDAQCVKANGRWCTGSVIHTCQGGRYQGNGDCGFFGAGCQEDGEHAFCVHPFCPAGSGLDSRGCVDATRISSCNDGQLSEGDCAAFGLVCGGTAPAARCMDARCTAGPDGRFCQDAATAGVCAAGVYTATACAGGETCTGNGACVAPVQDAGMTPVMDASVVGPVDAAMPPRPDGAVVTVDASVVADAARSDAGGDAGRDAGGAVVGADSGGGTTPPVDPPSNTPSCGGCTGSAVGGVAPWLAGLMVLRWRRSRRARG